MEELLTVSGLSKTFHLSKKQQKLEKTTEKVKVAVDDLSFCTYRGEVFVLRMESSTANVPMNFSPVLIPQKKQTQHSSN